MFVYTASEFGQCPTCGKAIWPGQRVYIETTDSTPIHLSCNEEDEQ
jgi:hypothetical protein